MLQWLSSSSSSVRWVSEWVSALTCQDFLVEFWQFQCKLILILIYTCFIINYWIQQFYQYCHKIPWNNWVKKSSIFFSVTLWAQCNKKCLFFCLAAGEWRPLVLGRAHSAGQQCVFHWRLRNVEPVRLRHHVPLCTVSQTLRRWTLKCTVHHR